MSRKTQLLSLISISLILLIGICFLYYYFQNSKAEVVFFDIGQGDSALINLPGNNEILIDGGPDKTILYKLGKYLPVYDRTIELMILTHPHADHCSGLSKTLDRYQVKKVMYTGVEYDSAIYSAFLNKVQNIERIPVASTQKIQLDENNTLEIIYPENNLEEIKFDDVNDSSIVVRLDTPNQDFLFTGDVSVDIEKQILEKFSTSTLKADVLKVAHQGSITSSAENFLRAVSPTQAVISVGENNFGHPSLRVVRRLERLGVTVFRTDLIGDIKVEIN